MRVQDQRKSVSIPFNCSLLVAVAWLTWHAASDALVLIVYADEAEYVTK